MMDRAKNLSVCRRLIVISILLLISFMPEQIDSALIQASTGSNYQAVSLRIAFCILVLTGIYRNELLTLKVDNVKILLNHQDLLSPAGRKILKDREKDFMIMFLIKEYNDSYIFSSDLEHHKMLRRETLTKAVNKIMKKVSHQLLDKPNITTSSFRVGLVFQILFLRF